MGPLQNRARATPVHAVPAASTFQLEDFARRYYECFNQRWFEEGAMFVDPGAVFTYPLAREHLIGRAGYRELARRWLEGFPDACIDITAVHVLDERTVATDWIAKGTHMGQLDLPGLPPMPPTAVHTQMPMRETITILDGRIMASRMDFDPAELANRLGLTL